MKITIANTLLGSSDDGLHIGGFSASGKRDFQIVRGSCDGSVMQRIGDRGNPSASFSAPLVRTFESIGEAEKWIVDTAASGGVFGAAIFEFQDGSVSEFSAAVAEPEGITYRGVRVSATWQITVGDTLP